MPEPSGLSPEAMGFTAPIEKAEKKETPVEVTKDKVSVLGVEISRNQEPGDRTPSAEDFKNFSEDEFSLGLLKKIAISVKLEHPLLLEGEAAIGKSFSIEYLAHLANKEVYRMSLNGQTDTADLIGKWVPRSESGYKVVEAKMKHPERLSEVSRAIYENAQNQRNQAGEIEPRHLTKEEMAEVAKNEGISVADTDWVWQDGMVPKAMREGGWLVLDELNTCEPQILVRLNSILEKAGKLVLQEDGDRDIPRHKEFRIFGTMNPPGGKYKGRIPLSAEFVSRWAYQNLGKLPKEVFLRRTLLRLGISEPVEKGKLEFVEPEEAGVKIVDLYGKEWTRDLGVKYTTFLYEAQELVDKEEIGKDQHQKFDFDQRDMDRVMDYIEIMREPGKMSKTIKEAIEFYCVNKCKSAEDRKKILNVADLIKVAEPKEKIPTEKKKKEKYMKNKAASFVGRGLPGDIEKRMLEKLA